MSNLISSSKQANTPSRWLLKTLLTLGWVFLIIAGYFWAHKPFDTDLVTGLGHTVLSIAFWLGAMWIAAGLGRRVVGSVIAEETPVVRVVLSAGAGLGLVSLLLLFLAIVGVFNAWAVAGLLILLSILCRRDLHTVLQDALALERPKPQSGMQRWILLFSSVSLVFTFILALAPPTAWDSLAYHLTGARFTVESGQILHPVDIPHLGFPLLAQMQFALGMLFLGDGPAALFHFGYGLMVLALTVALARRAYGKEAGWYSAAILLSIPTLHTLLSWPYVDGTLLFYATMAFYAFVRWRETYRSGAEDRRWLLVLGLACGFSGSVKYTAVLIPVSIALSVAWMTRREGLVALARRLFPVALVALILVSPYLLENWLTTGNPLYPFFFDDGLYWDSWRAWWYDRPGTGLAATAPWRLPLVPLEATILGTEGTEFYEATVGPLLLLSLGLLVVVWPRLNREERALSAHMLLFVAINYLMWLNGVARTALLLRARFLFFIFGIVAVLGSVALARISVLRRPQLDVAWMVRTFVVISMGLILFNGATEFLKTNPLPVIFGLEDRHAYEERRLGAYVGAIDAVNELPAGAKVDFLWESRTYACAVECWPDMILDRYLHYTQHYGYDAQELASHWRREGYTHVLLHDAGLAFIVDRGFDPVRDEDLEILNELKTHYLMPVSEVGEAYTLFAVKGAQADSAQP